MSNSMCVMLGFLIGTFVTLAIVRLNGTAHRADLFTADRSCRPGMVLELLSRGKALCVGGDGETWVVNHEETTK